MKPLRPKKRWGQNFLTDRNIAKKIVLAAEAPSPRLVIEIGPGKGALTELILPSGDPYIGIEIDPKLGDLLEEKFAKFENFNLVKEDVLKVDFPSLIKKYPAHHPVIIGNIPYNITSPILFKLFDDSNFVYKSIIMMQKEVAERLEAQVGNKKYGLLAINGQLFADVEYLFTVPAKLFYPQPKVDSAVVSFTYYNDVKAQFSDFELFRKITRTCFQQRRKMLRRSLLQIFSSEIIANFSIEPTLRPERLSIQDWQQLTEEAFRELQKEAK